MNTTTDYTNRLIDIECIKAIRTPDGIQSVRLALTDDVVGQAILTGIEKAIQRYVILFLTPVGSVQFDSRFGTRFTSAVVSGYIVNYGQLASEFAYANTDILQIMQSDIESMPDDEIVDKVEMTDSNIDFASSTLSLTLTMTMRAGTSAEFVIPTSIVKV